MAERLLDNGVSLVSRPELVQAAAKGKILKKQEGIFVSDLPYLSLKTEANRALLGWLERDLDRIHMMVRQYNAANSTLEASFHEEGEAFELPAMLEKVAKALHNGLTKNDVPLKGAPVPESLTLRALEHLGEGWLDLTNGQMEGMENLLLARAEGLNIPTVMKKWLPSLVIKGKATLETLPAVDQSLFFDLTSEPAKAQAAYAKVGEKSERDRMNRLMQAWMYLDSGETGRARNLIPTLERLFPKTPEANELAGIAALRAGARDAAAADFRQAAEKGSTNPVVYSELAKRAAENKSAKDLETWAEKAAEMFAAAGRMDLANRERIRAARAGAPAEILDGLQLKALIGEDKKHFEDFVPSLQGEDASVKLAKARLALLQGKNAEAKPLFIEAAENDPKNFHANRSAGEFFLNHELDIDKGLKYFSMALRTQGNDPVALRGQAWVNAKASLYDRGVDDFQRTLHGEDPAGLTRLIQYFGEAKQAAKAQETADKTFAIYPDYSPAVAALVGAYRKAGDTNSANLQFEILKKIDPTLAQKLTEAEQKKTETKPGGLPPKPERKDRPPLQLAYPVVKTLMQGLPSEYRRVGLVSREELESSFIRKAGVALSQWSKLNSEPLVEDVKKALAQDYDVFDDPALLTKIKKVEGAYKPEQFADAMKQFELDAVALVGLNETPDGLLKAELYVVANNKDPFKQSGLISLNQESLRKTNFWIFIPILLILAGLGFLAFSVFKKLKKRGHGKLVIRFRYNQTFEHGYFAVRLSKRELKEAFAVDKLMKTKWPEKRSDIDAKIRSFFHSYNPLIGLAEKNQIIFPRVSPGQYQIYVTAVIINVDTYKPLGTHELKRVVVIEKDKAVEQEITLDVNEAYVEIRATREVKVLKNVQKTVDGQAKSVEEEVLQHEEQGGVTIEVNDDPALTKVTIKGEPVSYYFAPGTYRLTATFRDLSALHTLEVRDNTPQTLELRLLPKLNSEPLTFGDQDFTSDILDASPPPTPAQTSARPRVAPTTPPVASSSLVPPPMPAALSRPSPKPAIPAAIELSDDLLNETAAPVITHNVPGVLSTPKDISKLSIDIDEVLQSTGGDSNLDELFNPSQTSPNDESKEICTAKARELQRTGRLDEAAELYLRAGEYDSAAELCQRTGNQVLTYKIYGISYLKAGNYREAAEMLKYAEEPLLEAEALEGLRLFDEANRKRGAYWEERGDIGRAMTSYQKASAFDLIGAMHERLQNYQQAGESYMRARLHGQAAECFLKASDIKRAAEALEMDGQHLKAAELYKKLGSNAKVFNLLEKAGRFCEAAEGYKKHGLLDEAIHACQQVPPRSADYLKSALIMGKIFLDKNELSLARSVYHKVVENAEISTNNIESYYEFGVLIQEQGQVHEAYALFEKLQTVKYNYADVNIRMQNMAERISAERSAFGTAPPPGTVPPFPGYQTSAISPSIPGSAKQTPVSSRYYFETELGRGAMGIVYKARDTSLGRLVAYKTVSNAIKDNPAALRYFLSEAQSLAALNHGNIVTVYDVGQENNSFFITMEFVDGRSLSDFIMEKGRLTLKNCVIIALKICAGLEYAHQQKVIHRDIKPSNIMISNQGEVKIMDFGLAKIMNDAMQDKTIVRGTPLYMAPEQVEGIGVDHRADLYSFGVTLFEMATGTLPFTKGDIAYHHLHTAPPSPIRYNPSIPESLERVILKCLEKDKDKRYQSASEIKRDLIPIRQALLNQP